MNILARLGHVILGLGILFGAIIIMFGAATVAYYLWIEGNPHVSKLEYLWSQGRWFELVLEGLIPVPLRCLFNVPCLLTVILTALIWIGLAAIPIAIGAAICYLLGGFSSPPPAPRS